MRVIMSALPAKHRRKKALKHWLFSKALILSCIKIHLLFLPCLVRLIHCVVNARSTLPDEVCI